MKRPEILAALFLVLLLVAAGVFAVVRFVGDGRSGGSPDHTEQPEDEVAESPDRGLDPGPDVPETARTTEVQPVTVPTVTPEELDRVRNVNPGDAGTIAGAVIGPQEEIVAGATVSLGVGSALAIGPGTRLDEVLLETQTDGAGRFQFADLAAANDYIVQVMHPQYGDALETSILVEPGQTTDLGAVQLSDAAEVSGIVSCAGRPIGNARVVLRDSFAELPMAFGAPLEDQQIEPEAETVTDGRGMYRFESVSLTNFEVTVDAEGYGLQTRSNPASFNTVPEDVTLDFDLTPAQTIRGVVLGEDHRPIAGATVEATLAGAGIECSQRQVTEADGVFLLDRLHDGVYTVRAEAADYSAASRPGVQVGITNLQLVLPAQGRVMGRVLSELDGSPVPSFHVQILRQYSGREQPAPTGAPRPFQDDGGFYRIGGLDPGDYILEARATGFAPGRSDVVRVERDQEITGVDIVLDKGGTLLGRVVNSSGDPVRGAVVTLHDNNYQWSPMDEALKALTKAKRPLPKTRTKRDGLFRLELIVPGTYQLAIRHPMLSPLDQNDVEVMKGQEIQLGDFELSTGGVVEGTCLDEFGNVLAGATVVGTGPERSDYFTARCDENGYYRMAGMTPGEYTIRIQRYTANPPENVLVQMLKAHQSQKPARVMEDRVVRVDLQLSAQKD